MSRPELERTRWLGVLARARPDALERLVKSHCAAIGWRWLRAPEIGLVMARGRAGGEGARFNLGETTATRCALRLDSGEMGVACVLGRDRAHAANVALVDALMQTDRAASLASAVLAPLAAEAEARTAEAARKAAATRVEFFTMTRGE